jgi:hypothetical protein
VPDCARRETAPWAVFGRVEVPARQRLRVRANVPFGVSILDGCGGACLATSHGGGVGWQNPGAARTVIVAVRGEPARRTSRVRVYATQ